jgi:putative Mg2+ transporter-C (MgtC) family protein
MEFIRLDPVQLNILWHVALAMALGAVIGIERETADKPAGLRTNMLVAGGAAIIVSLADIMIDHFGGAAASELIQADPIRVIEAVITGVSFLGAGTILRQTSSGAVTGLTTAATILFSATIGVGVALSQWLLVFGATALVLITLRGLPILENWIGGRRR